VYDRVLGIAVKPPAPPPVVQEVITEEEAMGRFNDIVLSCSAEAARWQATSDEEQAVSTVTAGPRSPKVKEMRPLVTERWAPEGKRV
jgi:hypothetical protein